MSGALPARQPFCGIPVFDAVIASRSTQLPVALGPPGSPSELTVIVAALAGLLKAQIPKSRAVAAATMRRRARVLTDLSMVPSGERRLCDAAVREPSRLLTKGVFCAAAAYRGLYFWRVSSRLPRGGNTISRLWVVKWGARSAS